MSRSSGRHFLQIPGPTNTPLPILAAIAKPTIDHRSPEFAALGLEVLSRIRSVFKTEGPVVIYPTSGTGAWEAALVNTLSPGDRVLMFETGWFSTLWSKMATELGLRPEIIPGDWRSGVSAERIAEKVLADTEHAYKAVAVVHNETSTGVKSAIEAVRRAIDEAKHPALLLVDTISSLGSMDYRHDEWGVDVTVCGSQKGLMLPPGLGFNAISAKALEASRTARTRRSFLGWHDMLASNAQGFFPYTPSTNLLQGLKVALDLIEAEGLTNIFSRHDRAAHATRRAVQQWGFEIQCRNETEFSSSLTAVRLPQGHSADALRRQILQDANLSLGNGLGPLADRVFRIGHLGDFNDASVLGTLAAIEMGLKERAVPFGAGAIEAAIEALSDRRAVMAEAAE
jgi:alanine-glyoxylate transaminase / serine-glyoxylate transaminase / serine-pyruvate transaminase